MSKGRRELDFLRDIEDAIERILDYTTDFTWERYLRDYKTQDAVVRNLEVIGEATKNLSDEFRVKYPEIPWQEMAGTMDRLMHHYFGINQEIVWQIVEKDLPDLKKQIEQAINEFPGS
ncbi:MAG: DUF86 domain-containing protein [Anaerolineales bacterium]|nr:DUF86 domain-containing protein [Anaerolineales bacterium]